MRYDPPNYVMNFVQTRKLPFTVVIDSMGKIAQVDLPRFRGQFFDWIAVSS